MLPLSRAPPACGVLVSWLSPPQAVVVHAGLAAPAVSMHGLGPVPPSRGEEANNSCWVPVRRRDGECVCVWVAASSWGLCRGLNWQCESVS